MDGLKLIKNDIVNRQNELIERYFNYIDVSYQTEKEYSIGLKNFFEYCKENDINNVQRQDIINYRDYLQNNNKSANTINLYLASIKNFFKWLNYEGIYKDISQNIKTLPVESTHIRESLSIEQVKVLLDNCQTDKEKLIISLGISTGIRCNEMCNIRVQDFVIKNNKVCLYVLGKARNGMRPDFVVISNEIYEQVKEYIKNNNIVEYLFISNSNNNKGNRISTRTMRNIVNNIYQRAGIKNKNLVFHSMRHGFCNINLQSGISIQEVSMAMRHKELSTTMRYVKDIETENNKCYNQVSNLLFT